MKKDKSETNNNIVNASTPLVEKKITQAEQIWTDIKDIKLEMFGIAPQPISKYCSPVPVNHNKLYLSYKVGAVLPAMENAIGKKYDIELFEKYISVAVKWSA